MKTIVTLGEIVVEILATRKERLA
jgi:hypothetical protein